MMKERVTASELRYSSFALLSYNYVLHWHMAKRQIAAAFVPHQSFDTHAACEFSDSFVSFSLA
jgi:hypothetical protein